MYADWGIQIDSITNNFVLQLNRFDGALMPPLYLVANPPNMLPTVVLTGVNVSCLFFSDTHFDVPVERVTEHDPFVFRLLDNNPGDRSMTVPNSTTLPTMTLKQHLDPSSCTRGAVPSRRPRPLLAFWPFQLVSLSSALSWDSDCMVRTREPDSAGSRETFKCW